MKKIVIALCLGVASSYAAAATWTAVGTAADVCSGGTGYAVGPAGFVTTAFTPKCSANTIVAFDATANLAAVGAVSTKGNQSFKGNSNGGAVVKHADCTTCTTTESGAAVTQALTDGGGSS